MQFLEDQCKNKKKERIEKPRYVKKVKIKFIFCQ